MLGFDPAGTLWTVLADMGVAATNPRCRYGQRRLDVVDFPSSRQPWNAPSPTSRGSPCTPHRLVTRWMNPAHPRQRSAPHRPLPVRSASTRPSDPARARLRCAGPAVPELSLAARCRHHHPAVRGPAGRGDPPRCASSPGPSPTAAVRLDHAHRGTDLDGSLLDLSPSRPVWVAGSGDIEFAMPTPPPSPADLRRPRVPCGGRGVREHRVGVSPAPSRPQTEA